MPEEATATSQAGETTTTTSQAETTNAETTSATTAATDIKDLPQWAQDHVKELRREAAANRTKVQQLEDAGKTELQRITDERDRLKGELDSRETRLRGLAAASALSTALSNAGAKPGSADLLVLKFAGQAELDDELNVKNTDRLVKAAKEQYPDHFRVVDGRADGGQGRQDGMSRDGKGAMNDMVRRHSGYAT